MASFPITTIRENAQRTYDTADEYNIRCDVDSDARVGGQPSRGPAIDPMAVIPLSVTGHALKLRIRERNDFNDA